MENLLNECTRRDIQRKLNSKAPKHVEVLVICETVKVVDITVPFFTPMEFCKN